VIYIHFSRKSLILLHEASLNEVRGPKYYFLNFYGLS